MVKFLIYLCNTSLRGGIKDTFKLRSLCLDGMNVMVGRAIAFTILKGILILTLPEFIKIPIPVKENQFGEIKSEN